MAVLAFSSHDRVSPLPRHRALPHERRARGRGQLRARARAPAARQRRARHRQDAPRRGDRRGARRRAHPLARQEHDARAGRALRLRHGPAPLRLALRRRRRQRHPPLHQARPARARRSRADERVVLLIDEVDKADLEFPNDLLHELDRMRFLISETGDEIVAQRAAGRRSSPATTRRSCPTRSSAAASSTSSISPTASSCGASCAVHHPDLDDALVDQAARTPSSRSARDARLRKRPSTSELIDWIAALKRAGIGQVKLDEAAALPRRPAQERAGHRAPTPTSSRAARSFG